MFSSRHSSRRLLVSLCAPCRRVVERAAVFVAAFCTFCLSYRQAGREASRHRIDKLAVLWHGHHLVRHAVLPVCGVVRGVEAAFSRECVRSVRQAACMGYTAGTEGHLRYQALRHSPCPSSIASSVHRFHLFDIGSEHISGVLVEIR